MREAHLSSLFGALIEEATLAKRLAVEPLSTDDSFTAESLGNRVVELNQQADRVCEWLHAMAGLIEPEPSMPGWNRRQIVN
jgi:two-component system, chemotaxis family, protein-glutamate methylesterase/glutaminase